MSVYGLVRALQTHNNQVPHVVPDGFVRELLLDSLEECDRFLLRWILKGRHCVFVTRCWDRRRVLSAGDDASRERWSEVWRRSCLHCQQPDPYTNGEVKPTSEVVLTGNRK